MSGVLRTYSRILDMNHDRKEKLLSVLLYLKAITQKHFPTVSFVSLFQKRSNKGLLDKKPRQNNVFEVLL